MSSTHQAPDGATSGNPDESDHAPGRTTPTGSPPAQNMSVLPTNKFELRAHVANVVERVLKDNTSARNARLLLVTLSVVVLIALLLILVYLGGKTVTIGSISINATLAAMLTAVGISGSGLMAMRKRGRDEKPLPPAPYNSAGKERHDPIEEDHGGGNDGCEH